MSSPSQQGAREPLSPVPARAAESPAAAAASPGPRSGGAGAPPATPLPARAARGILTSPRASPAASSAASRSPVFARTPGSGGEASPSPSPLGSPSASQDAARTPARRPSGSPAASPTGAVGTPARGRAHRGFLGTAPGASPPAATPPRSGRRRVAASDDGMGSPVAGSPSASAHMDMGDEGSLLYGTSINDKEITVEFHRFINNYRLPEAAGAGRPYYLLQLEQLWEDKAAVARGMKFPINGNHLGEFAKTLYRHLINFPTEVIPIFDRELWHISVSTLKADPEELSSCQVKIFALEEPDHRIMRLIDPTSDIERLVALKGIVIRCSDLVPDMQSGLFQCTDCKHEVKVLLSHWTIDEPTRCENCGKSATFQIVHNDCVFGDRQLLKLQEDPESIPEGETPQNIVIYCYDDLVDLVRPGDRVEVTGIYRASAVRPIRGWSKCSAVYRTHIDAISVATQQTGRVEASPEERELSSQFAPRLADEADLDTESNTPEEIEWNKKVRALALEKDEEGKATVVDKLVQSFAPSIYEEGEVKKGLLCQLFGGTPKAAQGSRGRSRPEINTLLCGDPSTAKSQLMQYAYKLAPRAVYTSGKGSSAVGLTASINRDPTTKDLVLESGALVLADRGMCCIDEFDKMDENARAILHEAMEQQTVSVAKSGIVCSLNARTSILASANPKGSSYDPKLSVVDNINLPKNLMTRFDLIWLMLDKRNRELDRQLAEHLVSMYSEEGARKRQAPQVEPELFRRYVGFARRYVFPRLSDAAAEDLVKGYTDLRNQGSNREAITATPRILESLIRLSESLAKMELREEVTSEDVTEAIRLLKAATYAAAIDPETGLIDMEQLIAGVGAGRRRRHKELESLLEEVLTEKAGVGGDGLSMDMIRAEMNERLGSKKDHLLTEPEFNQAVRRLEDEGRVRRKGKSLELRSS